MDNSKSLDCWPVQTNLSSNWSFKLSAWDQHLSNVAVLELSSPNILIILLRYHCSSIKQIWLNLKLILLDSNWTWMNPCANSDMLESTTSESLFFAKSTLGLQVSKCWIFITVLCRRRSLFFLPYVKYPHTSRRIHVSKSETLTCFIDHIFNTTSMYELQDGLLWSLFQPVPQHSITFSCFY